MTIIFIENLPGSGQVVTVAETFRKQRFERNLRPGENGCFLVSPFKSIVVSERVIEANAYNDAKPYASKIDYRPRAPTELAMRGNHD